jgi:hypothetical protein
MTGNRLSETFSVQKQPRTLFPRKLSGFGAAKSLHSLL